MSCVTLATDEEASMAGSIPNTMKGGDFAGICIHTVREGLNVSELNESYAAQIAGKAKGNPL